MPADLDHQRQGGPYLRANLLSINPKQNCQRGDQGHRQKEPEISSGGAIEIANDELKLNRYIAAAAVSMGAAIAGFLYPPLFPLTVASTVYAGMRNWQPFIAQTLRRMIKDEVHHAVVICLAPHNSRTSVGLYRTSLRNCSDPSLSFDFVDSWHDEPLLIQAFAEKLCAAKDKANSELGSPVTVIFTAHSVPERTVLEGDPYETQARQTAELVAAEASLEPLEWRFAFQSQGASGGAWLGPTVQATILDLKRSGHKGVLIQPIGFLCDHVEVLYDIDVLFKQFAEKEGLRLWRTESLNESSLLTSALAAIVHRRLRTALETH